MCNHFSCRDGETENSETEKEKRGLKSQIVYCNTSKTGKKRKGEKNEKGGGSWEAIHSVCKGQ